MTSEVTVTTSLWHRIASPDGSAVVLKFYLPENFLMHVFRCGFLGPASKDADPITKG